MKKVFFYALSALLFVTASCKDDNKTPEPVNEEEVITTLTVKLTPTTGTAIELKSFDDDGDGPNSPALAVSSALAANTVYSGTIELLNELESPAENITDEVNEESDEHQFVFTTNGLSDVVIDNLNTDTNGMPLGSTFDLTTGAAGSGTITFTLRHEPTKPNDGTLAEVGGDTDIEATFDVVVQ
jgi:hypothetical protein